MDCDKFEPLLLDELYEELDELTSAAVKRHVAGCGRCGSIFNGLRATRRAISLPLVPVPEGLEDRILAAAKEAQKVVPLRNRISRVISVAGSWAMRPQTAMAAVFLLMVGTSAFVIRSKNYASKDSTVSVIVQGEPSPTVTGPLTEAIDDKAAAAAHGPSTPNVTRPPAAPSAGAIAMNDKDELVDRLTGGAGREPKSDDSFALGSAMSDGKDSEKKVEMSKAVAMAAPPPAPTPVAPPATIANAGAVAGAPYEGYAQAPAKTSTKKRTDDANQQAQDPFALGAAAFRARDFAEATRHFDEAAQNGDTNAALWAAESVREGQGCALALGRFDQLSQKAAGSWVGNEAALRAARCQIAMGQLDPAREKLNRLAQVPSHQQAAQQAMNELQVAERKKAGGTSAAGGAAAAQRRAAPPAPKPAAPSTKAPATQAEQQKPQETTREGY
jgi:hypothetical protein